MYIQQVLTILIHLVIFFVRETRPSGGKAAMTHLHPHSLHSFRHLVVLVVHPCPFPCQLCWWVLPDLLATSPHCFLDAYQMSSLRAQASKPTSVYDPSKSVSPRNTAVNVYVSRPLQATTETSASTISPGRNLEGEHAWYTLHVVVSNLSRL